MHAQLVSITIIILAISATSATVERVISKHGIIYSKDRNRLNTRIERLLKVQTYY